jgi:hypothetical protein
MEKKFRTVCAEMVGMGGFGSRLMKLDGYSPTIIRENSRSFAVESSKRGRRVHPGIASCIGRSIAALSRHVGSQNMHQPPPPQECLCGGGVPGATGAD